MLKYYNLCIFIHVQKLRGNIENNFLDMMKNSLFGTVLFLGFTISIILSCKAPEKFVLKTISVEISNPSDFQRQEVLVSLPAEKIFEKAPDFNENGFFVKVNGLEIPSQYNSQGLDQEVVVVLDKMDVGEKILLELNYDPQNDIAKEYPKRTQAELSHKFGGYFENRKYIGGEFQNVTELNVPQEHTDHSWFIRYEGPGWESDKVGYRFYLDWRNGVDVFGKKTTEPILQLVGQDGFDSYHEMQDWGMDVLKVANSLGVGSIATFSNGKAERVARTDSLYAAVNQNGSIYSSILTKYHGWDVGYTKTNLTSELSIHAGSRLSKQVLKSSEKLENFATGLIKDENAELVLSDTKLPFSYMATYGKQSLNDDLLGIAVLFPTGKLLEITEDEFSHVVVLDGSEQEVTYYFLAAWELEVDGIKNQEDFIQYLNQVIAELSEPIKVEFQ